MPLEQNNKLFAQVGLNNNCGFDWFDNRKFKKGDRIAQLVVAKLADIDDAVEVDSLEDSERGAGGFGSTGA